MMARPRLGFAGSEQIEAVVEAGRDLLNRQKPDARRCQLNGQGQAVELAANLSHDRRVARCQRKGRQGQRGAFGKEAHGFVRGHVAVIAPHRRC